VFKTGPALKSKRPAKENITFFTGGKPLDVPGLDGQFWLAVKPFGEAFDSLSSCAVMSISSRGTLYVSQDRVRMDKADPNLACDGVLQLMREAFARIDAGSVSVLPKKS
jgi:hypothetical protein